ncbi:hypothetical protein C8J55DRAFT_429465 [Lentinula edodes]|uniref:Uncharacterized protein n=1 Tax=Lentinula lateritia TaxID=40482 RepID=A0A9W9ACZ9_9AGAR|nr:hypothetical protein C8J55DRAFT_429465 [Lentinula edodes]
MRNQGESDDDKKFRKALENMRYKACTPDDIRYLNTLVSSPKPGRHYIGAKPWRDAAIIVGENKQKDEINRLGCIRYGADTRQQLFNFYSDDSIVSNVNTGKLEKSSFKHSKKNKVNTISQDLQNILWELPPSTHEYHAPPVLSLCRGMPVIIRHNVATELNITKGQRGTVYAWHASKGVFGQDVLDVVFILLSDPPNPLKVDGLPPNVVPITRRKSSGYIYLPDDSKIYVSRFQVDILPGFSMTAHASQGQGMVTNATDLNTLKDHHAYYTALSRSRSAKNTVILQGFDSKVITGGASGSLRKEFRELELLDIITKLRYEGKLDNSVHGTTRTVLIESFLASKEKSYVPANIHAALRWSEKDPYKPESSSYIGWSLVDKKNWKTSMQNKTFDNKSTVIKATDANYIPSSVVQRVEANIGIKLTGNLDNFVERPLRLIWSNNSCAFDSIFVIVRHIWYENSFNVQPYTYLPTLFLQLQSNVTGGLCFEDIRDYFRRSVQHLDGLRWGQYCSTMDALIQLLKLHDPCIQSNLVCEQGHISNRRTRAPCSAHFMGPFRDPPTSTSGWLNTLPSHLWGSLCPVCNAPMQKTFKLISAPPIIAFSLDGLRLCDITVKIPVIVGNEQVTYQLKGVSYFSISDAHFVSRIVSSCGTVFFHDGMKNGGDALLEHPDVETLDLNSCAERYKPSAVIYAKC